MVRLLGDGLLYHFSSDNFHKLPNLVHYHYGVFVLAKRGKKDREQFLLCHKKKCFLKKNFSCKIIKSELPVIFYF